MSKLKRPEKIQTSINGVNGASSTTSSPSLSAKRPPSAQFPPLSATSNVNLMNTSVSRTANRPRRDAPPQLLGRGQRTTSAGLRSASIIADTAALHISEPRPYVQSDRYILKKYRGCPPSLIIHLHSTHFRFDQQDSTFKYQSPMKIFIEHLRMGTVPQDLLEHFAKWGIVFYEGCLIVEIHDHKSLANSQNTSQGTKASEKTDPNPIHKRSEHLTPSPWVPFSKQDVLAFSKIVGGELDSKQKTALEKDKENMPAPNQPVDSQRSKLAHGSRKPKISTTVLHPTPLAMHIDLAIKASTPVPAPVGARRESRVDIRAATPISASGPRPQTPMLAIPPTPHLGMEPPAKRVKREKMELDGKTVYSAEAQIALATTAPLFLDPVENADESARLLEALTHPEHSSKVPSPKTRKKTVAEMAAEESAAADEEQYMLILDERLSSNIGVPGAANPVDGDGQAGSASWEPRFERFKTIESIKLQVIENKKKEKMQQAENMKRQQQQEADAREKARQETIKRQQEEESNRQRMLLLQQQQQQARQQQQDSHRRQIAHQTQQNQANLQGQQQPPSQNGIQHAHPSQGGITNGMTNNQQRPMQGGPQFSQAQASSPVVRNTALSSPMVPTNLGAQMQRSNSNMGGSPPRPGSVVQQGPQMNPIMAQAMRAQGSQNSHGGTPRLPNAIPNMSQAGPRQINQTPRMSQPSPMPGHMIQTPQMNSTPMMMQNNPMASHLQIQQAQIAQQQQLRLRQAAAAQAVGSSPLNGQQLTPAQHHYALQLHQQQQNNQAIMPGGQVSAQYAAHMRQIAQAQAHAAMQQNGGNPNYIQNGAHPGMVQQQQAPGQQMNLRQQVQMVMQNFYQQGLKQLQTQYMGQVTPEALAQYKSSCLSRAQQSVQQQLRFNQMRQQQQQAAGMAQGMNMNGMGVQRPPGM